MKINKLVCLLGIATLAVTARAAEDNREGFFNHLRFSARFGANISAKFGPRQNAGGSTLNFLDGYVRPDSKATDAGLPFAFDPTGTYPAGITHNWGYDNSSRQNDAGNKEILFTSIAGGDPLAHNDCLGIQPGFELTYSRELGRKGKWTYGIEGAVNYMNICLNNAFSFFGTGQQTRYPYTFNGITGNTPPAVYQGTYQFNFGGPNFDIGIPPSVTNVLVNLAGAQSFDADILGFRLGPYLSRPIGTRGNLSLVGGLAVGLVWSSASWNQSLTVDGIADAPQSGSGSNFDVLWGWYVGANFTWQLSKRWDFAAGVQYQDLGVYRQTVGTREAELDLSGGIYFTVGVGYHF